MEITSNKVSRTLTKHQKKGIQSAKCEFDEEQTRKNHFNQHFSRAKKGISQAMGDGPIYGHNVDSNHQPS